MWPKTQGTWSCGLFCCFRVEYDGIRRRIRHLCVLVFGGLISARARCSSWEGLGVWLHQGVCVLSIAGLLLCWYTPLAFISSHSLFGDSHSIPLTSMPHHVVYNLWSFVTFSRWLEGLIVACISECDFISTNYNWMNIGYNVMKFAKQNKLTRVRVLIKRKLKKREIKLLKKN